MPKPTPDPVLSAVGLLAQAQRKDRSPDPVLIASARRKLLLARTERAIRQAINPPDTDYAPLPKDDRQHLASILLEDSA